MPSDYKTAFGESMTLLKAALDNSAYSEDEVEWPNVENTHTNTREGATDSPKPWIRVQWQHAGRKKVTIGSANGVRRYRNKGILTISRFSESGRGLNGVADFVTFANEIYDGRFTASGVTFRPMSPTLRG